ncbi:sensor histidine kinase [Jidongwangia harbinensis]|uniref:sensor histidine kinase n=1 Tax=Jidongwangia harbinensis TaxID=2878561 RepID=UPI001CD9349A|nr:histidine kinase [Jidongwangia harbinensis]MCA2216492.1 histidine kinase [Jidongwangia harbinensis]
MSVATAAPPPAVAVPVRHRAAAPAAALTFVGVPAGLVLTGGSTDGVMTLTLAGTLALAALLLRRWPLAVLVFSVLCVVGLRGGFLVGSGWVWPATAAFVAVVLAGRVRAAVAVGATALLYGFAWDGYVDLDHGTTWAAAHLGAEALWLAAVLAAAHAYRSTRRWQGEVAARLAQDEHERALEARRRRAEERVDIARDLHDVVSHTLAVVGVHLNVALDAFDSEPDEARASLRLAQQVRGRAMTDLKSLVDVLREGTGPAEPAPGLDGLERLADQVRAAGLEVSLTEFGERGDVPAPVATAVYRVVQESLTNTVRHAGAGRVTVTVRYAPTSVVVDVQDDGRGADPVTDGHGIAGMRERVAALGGALTAGPSRTGFGVRAIIPVAD